MIGQQLSEIQETAGFYEPNERVSLGGFFNALFFFSIIDSKSDLHEP